MKNIRNLIGSKLIDVEININGFTVLYFEDEKGNVYSVDLCPTVRKLEEGTVPEVPVQEQYIGKCLYCNETNEIALAVKSDNRPKYCMNCGKAVIYQTNLVF
ncbi:TPA: hypothetical protein N2D60_003504 [Clostridium botulinum]|nr:hypothetical protein [Clostridium botulinum]